MNPERPTDPREQLEVRITALLLGEASAFEEAELLEAIKNDPELAAYYEEMRQMVKRVEETIQLAPMVEPVAQPKLADARRDRLQELFRQPAPAKTIKLESPAGRAKRLGWLQHVAAIAAAMTILATVVWMLLPSYSKAKSKSGRISFLFEEGLSDRLGGGPPPGGQSAFTTAGAPAAQGRAVWSTNGPVGGYAIQAAPESGDDDAEVTVELDERFLARYGNSDGSSRNRRLAKKQGPPPAQQSPAPVKPADIYLPSTAGDSTGASVQMFTAEQARGFGANNTDRYYFRDSGAAAPRDSVFGQATAQVAESPTLAFVVPDASAVQPKPAPVPASLPAVESRLLSSSMARKDDAATESTAVLGKKLATPPRESADKSEVVELEPVIILGSQIPTTDSESRRRQLSVAEGRAGDFDGVESPSGGVRGRAGGASRSAQVDGQAAFLTELQSDPNQLAAGSIFGDRGGGGGFGGAGGLAGESRGFEGQSAPNKQLLQNAKLLHEMGRSSEAERLLREANIAGQAPVPGGPANAPAAAGRVDGFYDALMPSPLLSNETDQRESQAFGYVRRELYDQASQAQPDVRQANARFRVPGVQQDLSKIEDAWPDPDSAKQDGAAFGNQFHAANTWHADFGGIAAAPAVESFGLNVAANEFAANLPAAGELFAKQLADTKSIERLDRLGEETSLGLAFKEAKVPAGPVYEERLLTEERQLDRQRVKELSDQLTVGGESAELAEVELKRKAENAEAPPVFAQRSLGNGIRFLTTTNDMTTQNEALGAYLKAEGVELSGASTYFYNDRKGVLLVRAPAEELEKVERAIDRLNRGEAALAGSTTQSRFDTLADLSSGEFAMAADNGREPQLKQQVDSVPVAALEVAKLAEEVVEAQPATPPPPSLEPLPEISTKDNAFSTFSLNVSDVSFQLAASSLENGQMPDGAQLRSEEFINAFEYRDPLPAPGQRVAFNWERARNPFAHNRELLRFSVQTAAAGREPGQPLNLVLLLDNSGSMERADRVQITEQMLRVLAAGLNDYDRISVISFARTPRLIVDGLPGGDHQALLDRITGLNPDGGTNLEDALRLAYETAGKHFQANGNNRVILITDGAANLGNVDPAQLRERVIDQRKRGIALDCFGVGFEGYNDNLLESLSRNGDGRYGFLNDADNAVFRFSSQLAGALQVAAADVKAQVEFNPNRVTVYRQIGYQQHQLTKEQFRDNTVDAAEIGAAEAGNALYSVEINPDGSGPIGTFRARYRVPSTGLYEEKEWVLDYTPGTPELEKSSPAMRLASTAAAFAEWLANSPHAQSVTPAGLRNLLRDVPETFAPDPRPAKLQAMIQQARAISGR